MINSIKLSNLENAKSKLIPHIMSENYYNILERKIKGEKLNSNEKYYFNHYIKRKIEAIELITGTEPIFIKGKENILRLNESKKILKKMSAKYRHKKIMIAGSYLYNKTYQDIDIFIESRYEKEDVKIGKYHITFIKPEIEKTIFFESTKKISVSNHHFENKEKIKYEKTIEEYFQTYEYIILLILQKDEYKQELREFLLETEFLVSEHILNSKELNKKIKKIQESKNPELLIGRFTSFFATQIYKTSTLKKYMTKFIKEHKAEQNADTPLNWKIYNETYKEVLELVN